ncbi:MAG TPA: TonB-dependent receptor [Burkholderiales bacterium]|nr:TonB-dependent receptor [Burkholderiales bacterium]
MRGWAALAAFAASLAAHAQTTGNPATATEGPVVEVIGIRPVPGLGTPLREIPAVVQSATARELGERDANDVADHLARHFAGINLNDAQGNPFQQTLQYRGFTASPLLGLPQGLSVFVDGVRVNEAFGDMVNWDLIPSNAIATAHLISGSNPVFGLNTLGGVLSIQTKSGFAFPGTAARLSAGSFGRRAAQAETGGHGEHADYFAAVNLHDEAGWREHSPSALRQGFFKAGWQDARTDLDVSLALADNSMQGTQALPLSMLGEPRKAYTWPDRTDNELAFLTARASRFIQNDALVSASVYLRTLHQNTVASNINDEFDPAVAAGPGNTPGFNDRGALAQRSAGAALQLVMSQELGESVHELTFGASLDGAAATYSQDRQEAAFSADRGTVGLSAFVPRVQAGAHNDYRGLYFIDQFAPLQNWTLTLAGRYNVARVVLRDRSGLRPALDGDHSFRRFNPALGVNWNPRPALTWFASLTQGMRVPAPAELTCADATAPCSLPNQFLADPALKPVIARTVETGVRLRPTPQLRMSAALYRSVLSDDIQFVTSGAATNAGFFQNTGATLRQGLDLTVDGKFEKFRLGAAYSYINAAYLSAFRMRSPNNSSRDAADEIAVERGNAIPGIPQHSVKLALDWTPEARTSLGLGWAWFGRQYARGDENNRDLHGAIPAYSVAQAFARYRVRREWEVSLKVDNLFDRRYQSFGVLGRNFFTGPGGTLDAAAATAEQFVTPGAPRAVWIALRYEAR